MKTTVDIPDSLFREARQYAQAHELTFRQVVEAGLRKLVSARDAPREPFRLEKRSFGGDGLVKDFSWHEIRSLIYGEGREE